mmetsp:Transcript_19112/g.27506  ORF Transcript_19112/g.27506 Transcript_19112/m.27506 type:complete len:235 (+) Transcript_19112:61-765(+)
MPCFMSQSPAGIQIYLATSFIFTLGQGYLLRSDAFRGFIGLPLRHNTSTIKEAKYAQEFVKLKELEEKAKQMRGDGPVLGKGVLAGGLEVSFAGTKRPSTIPGTSGNGTSIINNNMEYYGQDSIEVKAPKVAIAPPVPVGNAPFIHGISAPPQDFESSTNNANEQNRPPPSPDNTPTIMEEAAEYDMERANRGESPVQFYKETTPANNNSTQILSMKRFHKKQSKRRKSPKKKR